MEGIAEELKRQATLRWVVDATHPFATKISHDLAEVCFAARQPLLRFERPVGGGSCCDPSAQKWCGPINDGTLRAAAVVSRWWTSSRCDRGLSSLGRRRSFLPVPCPHGLGLRSALAAGLPPDHLAVVRPLGRSNILASLSGRCAGVGGLRQWSVVSPVA